MGSCEDSDYSECSEFPDFLDYLDEFVDFLYSALVAASFEGGFDVFFEDLEGEVFGDEAGGKGEDVGVVVLTGEMGNLDIPAEGATYVGILINGHLDTISTSADDDAATIGAVVDDGADLMGKVGIITTVGGVGAKIFRFESHLGETSHHLLFQVVTCMVAGDRYYFCHNSYYNLYFAKVPTFIATQGAKGILF